MMENRFVCIKSHCPDRTVKGIGRMIVRVSIFVVICAAAGLLGVWASERTPPYILQNGVVTPDLVIHGERIQIESDIIVYRTGCTGVFQRTVTDAGGYSWAFPPVPTQFNELQPGKYRMATPIKYVLPMGAASGEACSATETTFYCNPLHKIWPIKTHTACVKFTVAP